MNKFGKHLLDKGMVTEAFLQKALTIQTEEEMIFGEAMIEGMKRLVAEGVHDRIVEVGDISPDMSRHDVENPPH